MSENHREDGHEPETPLEPGFLSELPGHDRAADALRDVARLRREQPPAPSPALAAFMVRPDLADPSLNHEQRRTSLMKVIHLKAARIRRAAAAAGAAVALATVGAAAMAATSDPVNTSVVQADPSDTTTTTEATDTETTEATETETADPTETETSEPSETEAPETEAPETEAPETEAPKPATTVNPRAYANHHDGKGADDEHADVRGGGSVDHRAEHQGTKHGDHKGTQQGDDDTQEQEGGDQQEHSGDHQESDDHQESGDHQQSGDHEDSDEQGGSDEGARSGGESHQGRH